MAEGLFGGGPFKGFYVGGQGGYGTSDAEAQDVSGVIPFTGMTVDAGSDGWSYGVLGGWGTTLTGSSVYLGIEGQYNWLDRSGEFSVPFIGFAVDWETNDMWSVGGRLGYLLGGNTMAFVRGAYASMDVDISVSGVGPFPLDVDTLTGYELGFGVEHIVGQNFTLRGEFVYSDYGNADVDLEGFGTITEVDDTVTEGRISLSYSF